MNKLLIVASTLVFAACGTSRIDSSTVASQNTHSHKIIVCEQTDGAGLESFELSANTNGKFKASITVSAAGDYMETYSYNSIVLTAGPHGAQSYTNGERFSLTLNSRGAGTLIIVRPTSSEIDAGGTLDLEVSCQ